MISIVLLVTGGLVWSVIGLTMLSTVLSRGPLARFLRRPALCPYTTWSGFRFKGVLLSRSRKPSSEVKTALLSASLRDAKRLRDALVEIDALPTIVRGKQALGLRSIFELSYRSVRHKKLPSPTRCRIRPTSCPECRRRRSTILATTNGPRPSRWRFR